MKQSAFNVAPAFALPRCSSTAFDDGSKPRRYALGACIEAGHRASQRQSGVAIEAKPFGDNRRPIGKALQGARFVADRSVPAPGFSPREGLLHSRCSLRDKGEVKLLKLLGVQTSSGAAAVTLSRAVPPDWILTRPPRVSACRNRHFAPRVKQTRLMCQCPRTPSDVSRQCVVSDFYMGLRWSDGAAFQP